MPWLADLIGKSPFGMIVQHSKKVHECVLLIREGAKALVEENYDRIMEIHHEMARLEYEADQIKDQIRNILYHKMFISVSRDAMNHFLSSQDNVADMAEDFVVLLTLRKTRLDPELEEEFLNFVDAVIEVCESLFASAEEIADLAESGFTGKEAQKVQEQIKTLGEKEWGTDKLQRRLARHFYSLESRLDPITIFMYDKYIRKLGQVANTAETAGKYLRTMLEKS